MATSKDIRCPVCGKKHAEGDDYIGLTWICQNCKRTIRATRRGRRFECEIVGE